MKEQQLWFKQRLHHCTLAMGVLALLLTAQMTGVGHGLLRLAQSEGEIRWLVSGQAVEGEMAGGESHAYEISLSAGQFVCFRLEQRAIDVRLILTAPDGKQLVESNLSGVGDEEALSLEALTAGSYKLMVRAIGAATMHGSYALDTTFHVSATEQDRKRLTAETLLREVKALAKPSGKMTLPVIE